MSSEADLEAALDAAVAAYKDAALVAEAAFDRWHVDRSQSLKDLVQDAVNAREATKVEVQKHDSALLKFRWANRLEKK